MTDEQSRRGRNNKRRGSTGEREICALLAAEFGIPVKRNLGQARDGGHDVTLHPFAIEVKRRARIAGLYEWIAQAQGGEPVVMVRGDGREWLVVMRFGAWCKLAREEIATS